MMRQGLLVLAVLPALACASPGAQRTPAASEPVAEVVSAAPAPDSPPSAPAAPAGAAAIAILPLNNNTGEATLDRTGRTLAEIMMEEAKASAGARVVERERLDQVLRELRLAKDAVMDQATAVRAGRLLGAGRIVFGSFSVLGHGLALTARVVNVETGEIVAAVTRKGKGTDELEGMARAAIRAALGGAGAPPVPAPSDADEPTYRRPQDPASFAIVIGVEKYANAPEARFAERDAAAVRRHLAAMGFPERNVKLLSGEAATRSGIEKLLEGWLPRVLGKDGRVIIYYSGHGAPDPQTGEAFLLPRDGDPEYLSTTAYPLKRLYAKLAALRPRQAVVVLDSCFSGAGGRSVLARGIRPLVAKVEVGLPAEAAGIVALTASGANQIAGSAEEHGHGLFTYYFLKGLNGAAADSSGRVTARGLHEYLSPRVADEANRLNRSQTPQLIHGAALRPERIELR